MSDPLVACLLLEDGGYLLLEDDGYIILEPTGYILASDYGSYAVTGQSAAVVYAIWTVISNAQTPGWSVVDTNP